MSAGDGGPRPAAPARTVSLHFVNEITPPIDVSVEAARLVHGSWIEAPTRWGGLVPWQEARDASAEGELPGGVTGSARIRIGTMTSLSTLNFVSQINDQQSNIDGSQTKFIVDRARGLIFTAVVSAVSSSSTYAVTLSLSGGADANRLDPGADQPRPRSSPPADVPDPSSPSKGDSMRLSTALRAAPLLGSAGLKADIRIANWIDQETTMVLQDPRLLQGQWVGEPPSNFSEVGWQEQQDYYAEGRMPSGFDGTLSVRISAQPGTARLVFKRNINQVRASFDGNEATPDNPYTGTWEGQKVKLEISVAGNLTIITLEIGNQQPG
jgi:hypothetical protein